MRAKISKTAEPPSAAAASADACRRLRQEATKARAARRRRKARSRPERRSRKSRFGKERRRQGLPAEGGKPEGAPSDEAEKGTVSARSSEKKKFFLFFWGGGRGCLLLIVWGCLLRGCFGQFLGVRVSGCFGGVDGG